jgi:hypothetical protein
MPILINDTNKEYIDPYLLKFGGVNTEDCIIGHAAHLSIFMLTNGWDSVKMRTKRPYYYKDITENVVEQYNEYTKILNISIIRKYQPITIYVEYIQKTVKIEE